MGHLLIQGNSKSIPLADGSVHMAVTSPPYLGLRDYGVDGQVGLEGSVGGYVDALVAVFAEVHRVLRDDGLLFLNLGDSYNTYGGNRGDSIGTSRATDHARPRLPRGAGLTDKAARNKQLLGIPWRVALALQDWGWYLRRDCIWHIPNPMTESVNDRPARGHEYLFLLTKAPRYYYDRYAVASPSKHQPEGLPLGWDVLTNLRTVWTISTRRLKEKHFAAFPEELPARCIRAGTSKVGCCPACGKCWTRIVEKRRFPTRPGRDTKLTAKADGDVGSSDTLGWNRPTAVGNRDPRRHVTAVRFHGWSQGCRCGEIHTKPCVVLDPFSGAATTGVAAESLGRDYIGIDLNPDYHAIGGRRIARARSRPKRVLPGQMSFFGRMAGA